MRSISIDDARPGMILAKNIYRESDGKILLASHLKLSEKYIQKIKELNHKFITIYTEDDLTQASDTQPICDETRIHASAVLNNAIEKLRQNEELDIVQIKTVITEMIDEILARPEVIYNLNQISTYDNYTCSHSVNVSILALMTGSLMGYNRKNLELLGIGALLHDIGKIMIDKKLLNKPSSLGPQEFEILKEHPHNGYEILKKRFPQSFLPAIVALQHHERIDGSGYPKGIPGTKIHHFAKIVAVADVFDAMTSNRIYQPAKPAYIAIREVVSHINTKYDSLVVDHFTRIVAPYPIGSVLILESGDKAIVTFVSRKKCLIRFVNGSRRGQSYDLYQSPDLKVKQVLPNKTSVSSDEVIKGPLLQSHEYGS